MLCYSVPKFIHETLNFSIFLQELGSGPPDPPCSEVHQKLLYQCYSVPNLIHETLQFQIFFKKLGARPPRPPLQKSAQIMTKTVSMNHLYFTFFFNSSPEPFYESKSEQIVPKFIHGTLNFQIFLQTTGAGPPDPLFVQ